MAFFFLSPAFTQEDCSLGMDGAQQIHHGRRIGAAHAEIDQGDAVGGGVGHGTVPPLHFHPMPFGEEVHVVSEIRQQNMLAELLHRRAGIARQPVGDDLLLVLH